VEHDYGGRARASTYLGLLTQYNAMEALSGTPSVEQLHSHEKRTKAPKSGSRKAHKSVGKHASRFSTLFGCWPLLALLDLTLFSAF